MARTFEKETCHVVVIAVKRIYIGIEEYIVKEMISIGNKSFNTRKLDSNK